MALSYEEALFLKEQIEITQPNTMLAKILKNELYHLPKLGSFSDLGQVITSFPYGMQRDYFLAQSFANFAYGPVIRYNLILSQAKTKGPKQSGRNTTIIWQKIWMLI